MTVRTLHTVCANGHLVLVDWGVRKCPMCDCPLDAPVEGLPRMDRWTGHVVFEVGYTPGGPQ